ncbi:MAG: SulP family inorganic anion transporter [Bacteroidia bacterium]|nr:SulP family inorganic anion transporter [Bacteroidia bacterium]
MVFLLALPLSLGIAKASEFPPAMGVLTAMIGGLVVGIFQGGRLTIKGPAAGLITVCSGAVLGLGGGEQGWRLAGGVIVVTAAIQIVFGLLKFGKLSDFFPHSAVHGMLAAIGIIIFAKQIPILLGVPDLAKGLSPVQLYLHIPQFITHLNLQITIIGITSLLILFGLPALKIKLLKKVPGPLIVLFVSVPLALAMDFKTTQAKSALVSIGNFWGSVGFNASFDAIGSFVFWKFVFMFLFVNSLESLLTVKAIDGLDPYQRKSNYNKDLTALGVGNGVAGILGGLPMISEVVRSAANVNFGGKTNWANVFHGLFLFLAMLLMIPLIELIPNAALAAMLIFAGYRLASPKEFIGAYKIGPEQLVIFLVTIAVTVAEDLMLGVFCGIIVKFIFHLVNGAPFKTLFKADYDVVTNHDGYKVTVKGAATFSNVIGYKKLWNGFSRGKNIVFNFSGARLVDHSFMEQLHHFEDDYQTTGGHVAWLGLEKFSPYSNHPLAARKVAKQSANKFEIRLNERQIELRAFADANDFTFYPMIIRNVAKFKDFPIEKGTRIMYEENILSTYMENGKVEVSDITLTEGAGMAREDTHITVLHYSDLDLAMPDFALEPEHIWTKLTDLPFGHDIDFENHPQFSHKYFLRGEDTQAIRAMFDERVIGFLETHEPIHVECHKNKLLFYLRRDLLTAEDIQFMIALANNFMAIVQPQPAELG